MPSEKDVEKFIYKIIHTDSLLQTKFMFQRKAIIVEKKSMRKMAFNFFIYRNKKKNMKIRNFFNYIKENLENLEPEWVSDATDQPIQREPNQADTSSFLNDIKNLNNRLKKNQYFIVEKDEYDEMIVKGIYNDLNVFKDDILEEIMDTEDIEENEINFDLDFMNDSSYIVVTYLESEDLYRVRIFDINSYQE